MTEKVISRGFWHVKRKGRPELEKELPFPIPEDLQLRKQDWQPLC